MLAVTLETLAQHLEHALGVQLLDQMIKHHLARFLAMNRVQALPRLGLRRRDEFQYQHRIERPHPVIAILGRAFAVIDEAVAAHRTQLIDDGIFEAGFGVLFHGGLRLGREF